MATLHCDDMAEATNLWKAILGSGCVLDLDVVVAGTLWCSVSRTRPGGELSFPDRSAPGEAASAHTPEAVQP